MKKHSVSGSEIDEKSQRKCLLHWCSKYMPQWPISYSIIIEPSDYRHGTSYPVYVEDIFKVHITFIYTILGRLQQSITDCYINTLHINISDFSTFNLNYCAL